jgi:hypothetical protein
MFNWIPYQSTFQQLWRTAKQTSSSSEVTTVAGGNSRSIDNPQNNDSQTSNATTITLSFPSQDASTESQDSYTNTSKLPSFAEKECQTMDGVFLSAEEYASCVQISKIYRGVPSDPLVMRVFDLPRSDLMLDLHLHMYKAWIRTVLLQWDSWQPNRDWPHLKSWVFRD